MLGLQPALLCFLPLVISCEALTFFFWDKVQKEWNRITFLGKLFSGLISWFFHVLKIFVKFYMEYLMHSRQSDIFSCNELLWLLLLLLCFIFVLIVAVIINVLIFFVKMKTSAAPSQVSVKMVVVWMLLGATDVNVTKDSCQVHQASSVLVSVSFVHISSNIRV